MNKRRRDDSDHEPRKANSYEYITQRIKREICEIGEPGRFAVSESVDHLGKELADLDEKFTKALALNCVVAAIREQPHKIPFIAAALHVANTRKSSIVDLIIQKIRAELTKSISDQEWSYVKRLVRFLACIISLIEGETIYKFLQQILDRIVAEESSLVTNELYVLVALTLPILYISPESNTDLVKSLFDKSKEYQIYVNDTELELNSMFMAKKDAQVPCEPLEYTGLVRKALDNIDINEWAVDTGSLASLIHIETILFKINPEHKTETRYQFPELELPEKFNEIPSDRIFRHTRIYNRFYLPGKFETVPNPETFEAVLLRDIGTDIVAAMDFNRKEVARQLITLDLFFSPGTFAEPGITLEKLEQKVTEYEEKEEKSEAPPATWKVEDVALEIVLDHLFRMPDPIHRQVYYHSILIEMCIMAPQAIAPAFGRAVRFLFNNLETLDTELIYRFLDWFSHHLTNFAFVWKWAEWLEYLEASEKSCKYAFIEQLIAKEVRLSYPQRVRESLPEEFLKFVPSDEDQEPTFKYLDAENGYDEPITDLVASFRKGKTEDGMNHEESVEASLDRLNEKITANSVGESVVDLELKTVDLLVSTICYLGSRSLTHASDWVKRTKWVLQKNITTKDKQWQALMSIQDFWKGQPYTGVWVMTYFVTQKIVDFELFVAKMVDEPDRLTCHGFEGLIWARDKYKGATEELKNQLSIKRNEASSDESWWFDGMEKVTKRWNERKIEERDVEMKEAVTEKENQKNEDQNSSGKDEEKTVNKDEEKTVKKDEEPAEKVEETEENAD